MSDPFDLEINDLPPEETLTPEEKERLAGAGRFSFRPQIENLEARELMASNLLNVVPPSNTNHVGTMETSGASASTARTTGQFWGASDASAAVAVQYHDPYDPNGPLKDGVLVGDDKSDIIRLYPAKGGDIVAQYDLGKVTKTTFQPNGSGRNDNGSPASSDIEAAARVGNKIYWMTSSGDVIETQMLTARNDGSFEGLVATRKIGGLVDQLKGSKVGAETQVYVPNSEIGKQWMTLTEALNQTGVETKNYHNIEGFAIGPNGEAYIGFRSPLGGANGEALLIQVSNFQEWLGSDGNTSAQFTAIKPILDHAEWNGAAIHRGIRDIRWSPEMNKFVILAGNFGVNAQDKNGKDLFPKQDLSTQLYVWDGPGGNAKATWLKSSQAAPDGGSMSFEAIGNVTRTWDGKYQVQLFCDDGSTSHGKTAAGKANPFVKRYFWGEVVSVSVK